MARFIGVTSIILALSLPSNSHGRAAAFSPTRVGKRNDSNTLIQSSRRRKSLSVSCFCPSSFTAATQDPLSVRRILKPTQLHCNNINNRCWRQYPPLFLLRRSRPLYQSTVGIDGTNSNNHQHKLHSTRPNDDDDKNGVDFGSVHEETSSSLPSLVLENNNNKAVAVAATNTAAMAAVVLTEDQMHQHQRQEFTKMILNGLLLASSFGFAAYTIFNIDSGMTRGWTQGEIAMRIPLDNWLNYESSLADRPILTKTAINVIIYLLGDWLSQTLFSKKDVLDFDAARTLRNGFIGLCFGPLVHEYYQFSDYILPVEAGMFTRFQKILMDQTVYLTVKCSIYISAVGLLQGDDWKSVQTNVQTKLPNIVLTAWKFWPLVHLVTYGVIPARHRILWVNCVDLVWNAILATMSQKTTPPPTSPEEEGAMLLVADKDASSPQTLLSAEVVVVDGVVNSSTTATTSISTTPMEKLQVELVIPDSSENDTSMATTTLCTTTPETVESLLLVLDASEVVVTDQPYIGNATTLVSALR